MRKAIPILFICSGLLPIAAAQKALSSPAAAPPSSAVAHTPDFSETVVPITSVKIMASVKLGITGKPGPDLGADVYFATGFCLDAACRFIATNYHVAMTARPGKVKGEKIVQRYFATGPQDKEAIWRFIPNWGVLPYAPKRDLAIFELQRSLPHHHGIAFSLDEMEVGQQVDIYGYPKEGASPFRNLTSYPAVFKGQTGGGDLAFEYELPAGRQIPRGGASGGIVVDRKSEKIVGILSETTETTALAVPAQTLADFVSKERPFLAQAIFPATKDISPISTDLYPKFVPGRIDGLQHRPEEPDEVRVLRQKAHLQADSMLNFIAVQSFAWGSGDKEPGAEAAYEVRVIDGAQLFRRYPDGKDELKEIPAPHLSGWVLPSDEWSALPKMVGTEYRLKVHQAADVVVNEQRLKVFQYYAYVEDNLCPFTAVEDFGFFTAHKAVAVGCYGEVWTDKDTNIVRMSENLELSDKLKAYRGWQDFQIVLTYGWLERANEPKRLVPLTILTQARQKKHVYWCRGYFTDYHEFTVRARLLTN